ncbi:SDR family NAD(P)-dependent oxidoreductase [Hoeflea sp. AS60]|uniref:SDR family NAD(P)-dependent oxidoreductase n=1 Tax=Hoeflea sp. AS60 TaxID=3135780 RepID=UPI003181084F
MTRDPMCALVTGGSAGLGAAAVSWLQAREFDVVVLDQDRPWSEKAAVDFVHCDLASRTQLDNVIPKLIAAGPYDLVFLNAGINATGKFEAQEAQTHIDIMRVNAEAPMVIAARLLEAKAIRTGGAVVFVSSLSHFTGYPGAASYAASKDALAVYAKSMRQYAKSRGVTLTVAFPGPLKTDHAERHAPEGADASKRMEPDQAADLILTDACAGRRTSIPGKPNRFIAIVGRLFPKSATALMRHLIYSRLKP